MIIFIRRILFTLFIVFLSGNAFSQIAFRYPTLFSQFYNYYSFINPASTGTINKFELNGGNQFNTGYYSRIRCYFAQAEMAVNSKSENSGHGFGLSFMNNQEGNLLDFSRAYMQYAFHIELSEKWSLSTGISAGFLSFNAEQTTSSGKISTIVPDGSVGLWLYRDKEQLGISSSQILNNSIRVINERIPVRRYYRVIYSRNFSLSEKVNVIPAIQTIITKEGFEGDLNVPFLLNQLILTGAGYRYNRGTSFSFGVRDFNFAGGDSDVIFSYNVPWPNNAQYNLSSFELMMKYKIR